MSDQKYDRPLDDEIEVSLFGPGCGECIVIHLGGGSWVVIDSCMNKESQRAEALTYFDNLGIDQEKSVKLIVCTHWHDDHIRGIASILSQCPNAKFACSSVLKESAFLNLVALGEEVRGPHGSGVREIEKVLKTILSRRGRDIPPTLTPVRSGKLLLDDNFNGIKAKVTALSPSSEDHDLMNAAFKEKKDELLSGDYKRCVPSIHPNLGSVVLRVDIGSESILLGADMELRKSENSGWNAIITGSPELKSSIYKIAHHGSQNGDAPGIWSKMLIKNCLSVLTPNQRLARPIPKAEDISRVLKATDKFYATAPSTIQKSKLSQPSEKLFRRMGITVRQIPSTQGHVRMRKSLDGSGEWSVSMFGRAMRHS